jgi:hypothetical protein
MRRALVITSLIAAARAFADATITIDGMNSDWAGTTTCESDPLGDGSNGIDLTRVCQDNDNSSGNNGYLYALFEATNGFGTVADRYFGYYYDKNNDGVVTQNGDEVWAVHFSGNATTPTDLTVYQPNTFTVLRTYTMTSDCGGSGTANGWSAFQSNNLATAPKGIVEMRIAYGCLGLTFGNDNRLMQYGVYPNFDTVSSIYYDGTNDTVTPAGPPPDLVSFSITAGSAQNQLWWTNPSLHQGVLVLRSTGSAPNTAPVAQTVYAVGGTLGNATVRYVDGNATTSTVNVFSDTGLANGTRYFYKIYNHHQHQTYSAGNAPSSAGLFAEPTAKTGGSPLWCYSVGFSTLQQPTTELGATVFTGSNGGSLTANQTQAGASDGFERWRPAQLNGAVQSRPTLVPLAGRTGNYLITGDQTGRGYLISASTGAVQWTTAQLGDAIQGQPVVQLNAYANAAFQAAHPGRDVVFFATRNTSATNNKVYGVSSVSGAVLWTYQPGNLNIINGGMAVDYVNNRLWVASTTATNSVRVLSTLDGSQLAQLNLGAIDYGVNLRFVGGVATEAVTMATPGTVYGVDLSTMAVKWSRNVGVTATAWAYPLNTGFIAAVTNSLRRWDVLPDAGSTQVWSANVPGASGITIDYTTQTLYVGGSGSVLRQIELTDGGTRKSLTMPGTTTTFGQPTLDTTAGRLHVGTLDGRLCAFPAPFP